MGIREVVACLSSSAVFGEYFSLQNLIPVITSEPEGENHKSEPFITCNNGMKYS